ncbi:MAG: glycosyltransferase family 9 protein [bacterium]|nr:glycosyltransferase family 9 protein [bacterium]
MTPNGDGTRTLVVHTGGIGDFLLTLPSLSLLCGDGPVEVMGRPNRMALAVMGGLAEAAHDIDTIGFESLFVEPSEGIRAFLAGFDRVVMWMRDEGDLAKAVRGCGVEDVRAFPGLPPEDWSVHASEYFVSQLGYRYCPPVHLEIAPGRDPKDVVIHPGSGGSHKNCPMDRYAALARILRRMNRRVSWCLGPAEDGLELPDQEDVIQTATLEELARVLASTRLYVGNDSGITHLAAAAGCRTVAVFGPTNPAIWAPAGEHVAVVTGDPWPTASAICDAMDLPRV